MSLAVNHITMETGVIIEILERERGFIKRADVSEHLFFHADALIGMQFAELREGDKVEFSVVTNPKGSYAVEIRGLD